MKDPGTLLCVPLLHPSAIVQGNWHKEPLQKAYLHRILSGDWPKVDYTQPPPRSTLYPGLSNLEPFYQECLDMGWVSIDIENAGDILLCVGMTAMTMTEIGSSICLRFRTQHGGEYWTRRELPTVVTWLDTLLGNPSLGSVFHNGIGHDVRLLRRMGFEFAGPKMDTFVMAYATYSELPRGLQFCCTYMLGLPVWKTMINEDEPEGKG